MTANIAGSTGNFIVGSKYGIGIATNHDNGMHLIRSFWSQEETTEGKNDKMRANDGAVDCEGRFWVSALRDPKFGPFHPDGMEYRPFSYHVKRLICYKAYFSGLIMTGTYVE